MAWRPTSYLIEGILDNTVPNKVTGWLKFAGMKEKVTFDLKGDFHRDVRGAKVHLQGEGREDDPDAAGFMQGFSTRQVGQVGDMTAGRPPQDYVAYPYLEWYSEENGRIVLELDTEQVQVIGQPIPWIESDPVSREEQARNMGEFLGQLTQELDLPVDRAVCVGMAQPQSKAGQPGSRAPVRQLLTDEIRKQLPPLYSQDGKGGAAIAYAKFFTPDSSWAWFATGFDGEDRFFGLVDGHGKELGYFSLTELSSATGPLGLHIERDLHWTPTRLCEIAPELFREKAVGGES